VGHPHSLHFERAFIGLFFKPHSLSVSIAFMVKQNLLKFPFNGLDHSNLNGRICWMPKYYGLRFDLIKSFHKRVDLPERSSLWVVLSQGRVPLGALLWYAPGLLVLQSKILI
jgi:hypothetical protein